MDGSQGIWECSSSALPFTPSCFLPQESCTHKKQQQLRIKEKYPLYTSSFAFDRSASRMKRAFDNVFREGRKEERRRNGRKEGKGDGRGVRGRKGREVFRGTEWWDHLSLLNF